MINTNNIAILETVAQFRVYGNISLLKATRLFLKYQSFRSVKSAILRQPQAQLSARYAGIRDVNYYDFPFSTEEDFISVLAN